MSKTFKKGTIFLITVANLLIFRMVFSVINLSDNLLNWLFSLAFQVIAMGVIPYLLYRFMIAKEFGVYAKDMRISRKIHPLSFLIAIAVGILVYVINTAVSSVWYVFLNSVGYTYVSSAGTIYSSPEVLVFEILTSAMLPAIFEELTDRGLLLSVLDGTKMSDAPKIIIVGLFFGALHQNVAQFGPTIFGGIILAYLAVKGGSLFPAMIVHFLNNFIITMYDYSSQTGGNFAKGYDAFYAGYSQNYFLTVGVWALAILLLVLCLRAFSKINLRYREVHEPEAVEREKFLLRSVKHAKAPAPPKPQTELPSDNGYRLANDDFYRVYVARHLEADKAPETKITAPQTAVITKKETARWWDFGTIVVAAILALTSTVFTFIWGILR